MSQELICSDCGKVFRGTTDFWCSSCWPKHAKAISSANEEAYQQYERIHRNNCPDEADRKARLFAAGVARERARKGRHYNRGV